MMQVLVFGKTGQVARELAHFDGVTCLPREQADLSDPRACAQVIAECSADVIINAAAYTAVDKAEEDEDQATVINGLAVTAMALAAAERGIPFLHISTDYVFDGSGTQAWKVTDAVAPINAYGRSKLLGEQGVTRAGGAYAILRTSWVVSAHGNNFVKTMRRLGAERDALSIVADQIGGPTAAADIAAALMTMAKAFHAGKGASGTYHFSGTPDVSWADFAAEVFNQSKLDVSLTGIPTRDYPTPAKRPFNSCLECIDIKDKFEIMRPDWKLSLGHIIAELEA